MSNKPVYTMFNRLRNDIARTSLLGARIHRTTGTVWYSTAKYNTNTELKNNITPILSPQSQKEEKKNSKNSSKIPKNAVPTAILPRPASRIKQPLYLYQYSFDQILHLLKRKSHKFFTPRQISSIIQLAIKENKEVELYQLLIKKDYPVSQKKYAVLRQKLRNHANPKIVEEVYEMWRTEKSTSNDTTKINETSRNRILRLYNFRLIQSITQKYINTNDPEKSNIYFALLTSRYEYELGHSSLTVEERKELRSSFYETVTMFLVRMINYQNVQNILTVLMDSNIRINGRLLNMMITSLRSKGQYDLIFQLLKVAPRILSTEKNDLRLKHEMTREFFMALWYELRDIKIILAYLDAIYPGSWDVVEDQLSLVSLVYQEELKVNSGDLKNSLIKAEINEWFQFPKNTSIPHNTLTVVYRYVLEHIQVHAKLQSNETMLALHAKYLNYAQRSQTSSTHKELVSVSRIDHAITTLFLKHTLLLPFTPKTPYRILSNHTLILPDVNIPANIITTLFLHHGTPLSGDTYQKFLLWFQKYDVPFTAEFCIAVIKKLMFKRDLKGVKVWLSRMNEMNFKIHSNKLIELIAKFQLHDGTKKQQALIVKNVTEEQIQSTEDFIQENAADEEVDTENFKVQLASVLERLVAYEIKKEKKMIKNNRKKIETSEDYDLYLDVIEEMKK